MFGGLAILLFAALILIIPAVFAAKILKKAGFAGWLSLLILAPIANIICLWVFAFIEWPVENRSL